MLRPQQAAQRRALRALVRRAVPALLQKCCVYEYYWEVVIVIVREFALVVITRAFSSLPAVQQIVTCALVLGYACYSRR